MEGKIASGEDIVVPSKRRRYYTKTEVSHHNCSADCWVSIFGKVFDLTELVAENKGPLVKPILEFAGQDVSHWFDRETNDVKRDLDEETQLVLPVLPHGRFVHVAPPEPVADWKTDFDIPWWRDEAKYCIGTLSERTRKIRLVNMLSHRETVLEVCSEETLEEIQDRYLDWNAHSQSYTWKVYDGDSIRPLDMSLTLEENGIPDENDEFKRLSLGENFYMPAIHVYFNDDLTEA